MSLILANKIDKDGILREIDVIKKVDFIQDKKMENLYTLIERIRNEIDCINEHLIPVTKEVDH